MKVMGSMVITFVWDKLQSKSKAFDELTDELINESGATEKVICR